MSELFEMDESLSPRLKWMRRHCITIKDEGDVAVPSSRYRLYHGMQWVCDSDSELGACITAKNMLNLFGWEGGI